MPCSACRVHLQCLDSLLACCCLLEWLGRTWPTGTLQAETHLPHDMVLPIRCSFPVALAELLCLAFLVTSHTMPLKQLHGATRRAKNWGRLPTGQMTHWPSGPSDSGPHKPKRAVGPRLAWWANAGLLECLGLVESCPHAQVLGPSSGCPRHTLRTKPGGRDSSGTCTEACHRLAQHRDSFCQFSRFESRGDRTRSPLPVQHCRCASTAKQMDVDPT